MYSDTAELSLIYGAATFCGGILYCIAVCPKRATKIILTLPLLCIFTNYYSLYLKDYKLLLSLPYYSEYSHLIIRESLIVAVTSMTVGLRMEEKDKNLVFIVVCLYIIEYLHIYRN